MFRWPKKWHFIPRSLVIGEGYGINILPHIFEKLKPIQSALIGPAVAMTSLVLVLEHAIP